MILFEKNLIFYSENKIMQSFCSFTLSVDCGSVWSLQVFYLHLFRFMIFHNSGSGSRKFMEQVSILKMAQNVSKCFHVEVARI